METQISGDINQRIYKITELCNEFKTTTRALRFYEQHGLLNPARRGTTRLYSRRDHARLQLILRGKRFGFSLREIREMLDLYDRDNGEIIQLQAVLPKLKQQLDHLQHERSQLDNAIADLETYCQQVDDVLNQRQQDEPPNRHTSNDSQGSDHGQEGTRHRTDIDAHLP